MPDQDYGSSILLSVIRNNLMEDKMKKELLIVEKLIMVCMIMAMGLISGCASTGNVTGLQIKSDSQIQAIAEIAARRLGYQISLKEAVNKDTILKYINQMESMDDAQVQTLALYGMRYISTKYTGDPLLADDLMSIIKLLGIDLSVQKLNLDGGDIKTLKAIILAFKSGMGA